MFNQSLQSLPRLAAFILGASMMMAVPASADPLKDEIAPTGKLRVAIAISPAGGGVSLCIDTTLYLLASMLGQQVADETARIMEYQRAWRANRDGFAPVVTGL